MSGKEFEQGSVLGCYGGVEKAAGCMSENGLSNRRGTVVDADSRGTEGRFINDFYGLSDKGANIGFCVDSARSKSNGLVCAKCLRSVAKGAQFFVDYGCAW
jgi:hypothetical protein